MSELLFDQFPPLHPAAFFEAEVDVFETKIFKPTPLQTPHFLPDFSSLTGDRPFAKVALAHHLKGILMSFYIDRPLSHSSFPDLSEGDSIELFFDTRALKTTQTTTRFCHHLYILAEAVDDPAVPQAAEITTFRGDDRHELADSSLIRFITKKEKKCYEIHLALASEALFGYDRTLFGRLGFTYRINQFGGAPQHFLTTSDEFVIEKHPSEWATLRLAT